MENNLGEVIKNKITKLEENLRTIMGTNFYYKKPVSEEKQKEMKDLITENPDFYKLREIIEEVERENYIHLGKRSAGWQFLWNLNEEKWYKSNLESIKLFLETGGGWIENEYGEKFTTIEFLEEIGPSLYKDEKHDDLESYYKKQPKYYYKVNPQEHEFTAPDGLRFCKQTDFS